VPSPEQERLEAIARRQDELDARLARIEAALKLAGATRSVEPQPPPLPPPLPWPIPDPPLASVSAPPPVDDGLETRVGLNWINRIAVVTLIFGAAFFFKYAVDNDWIGPGARVGLGVTAAMISLFFGDAMWKREQKVFAEGLTGLGLALLYLSFYATFGLYHLLVQGAAFFLMVLTTAAAVGFALRYTSQAVAVLGLAGGYLTPIVLSTGEDHPWVLFSNTFVLNLAGIALARLRRWRAIEHVSFTATALLSFGWASTRLQESTRPVATVFDVAFYAQFAVSESRAIWWLAQFLAPLAAAGVWDAPYAFLPLDLLFAAGGLVVAEVCHWKETPAWTLACYWLSYWVWNALPGPTRDGVATWGLISPAFMMFLLWITWRGVASKRTLNEGDLLVLASNGAAYFVASYVLLDPVYHDYMGLFSVALGGVHLLIAKLLWKSGVTEDRESWPSLLAAGVALGFVTLAVPIQFTGFRITIAWALEGAAFSWLAARFGGMKLNAGAWAVFLLVLLRLFAFDAWLYPDAKQYTTIANVRFLTFAVSALSLWLAARFARTGIPAAAPYIAGHFVMLWILGLEIIGWAERTASPADQWSVETTGISILMALYSLMLVAIGVSTRTVINRMLGLGLMAMVVLKLYLLDVWSLGRFFRITAFLVLGGLLLLVSYLYSRFRPMIEKLWKDDETV
jgi:uncharacterized membrane protein